MAGSTIFRRIQGGIYTFGQLGQVQTEFMSLHKAKLENAYTPSMILWLSASRVDLGSQRDGTTARLAHEW